MALNESVRNNFQTLSTAFDNDNVCLLECKDQKTGEFVPVICAVHMDGDEYVLTPFAKMFTGNPYEEVDPPEEMNDETPVQHLPSSGA